MVNRYALVRRGCSDVSASVGRVYRGKSRMYDVLRGITSRMEHHLRFSAEFRGKSGVYDDVKQGAVLGSIRRVDCRAYPRGYFTVVPEA